MTIYGVTLNTAYSFFLLVGGVCTWGTEFKEKYKE